LPGQFAISIVDDDESVRDGLVNLMQAHGYLAEAFESGASFLVSDRRHLTDCLVADMHMPRMSGLDLFERLATPGPPIPTILITARHEDALRDRALEAGVLCYLTKPFAEDTLMRCIGSALGHRNSGSRDEDQRP
jgi:FixJ family two-component response regulator